MFQYDVMWGNVGRDIQKTRAEKTSVGTWIQTRQLTPSLSSGMRRPSSLRFFSLRYLGAFTNQQILINARVYSVHVLRVSTHGSAHELSLRSPDISLQILIFFIFSLQGRCLGGRDHHLGVDRNKVRQRRAHVGDRKLAQR